MCRRHAVGGQTACERSHRRTSRVWTAGFHGGSPAAVLAASTQSQRRHRRKRSGSKPVPVAPRMRSSACLPIRPRCNGVPRNCTSSNKRDRYWNSGRKLRIGLPWLLELGRSGRGAEPLPSHRVGSPEPLLAQTFVGRRGTTVCRRRAVRGMPACERTRGRTSGSGQRCLELSARPQRRHRRKPAPAKGLHHFASGGISCMPPESSMVREARRYCTSSNKRDRYWNSGGKLHVRSPSSPKSGAVSSVSVGTSFNVSNSIRSIH